FFGGIGGTYATTGYTPVADFLKLIFFKLTHLHYLFITHQAGIRGSALTIVDRATDLLIYGLLFLWGLRLLPEAVNHVRYITRETRWPTVDPVFLVTLWAALALTFYFALPLVHERYATSVVIFAWPALVAEVDRRAKATIWFGLAAICVVSATQSSYHLID